MLPDAFSATATMRVDPSDSPRTGRSPGLAGGDEGLRRDLAEAITADRVVTDPTTLHGYGTDASPCFVQPRAVVVVTSEQEVVKVVEVCRRLGVPITPRAAGTSLSGASIGPGVILDTTRLNRILELDRERRWIRVEPGILLSELNAFLGKEGLHFPIDPGSADLCRIGGMVGHNASGYRSVKYGQTKDHVLELRVVLANGTVLRANDLRIGGETWTETVQRAPGLDAIRRTIGRHRREIQARRRPVQKHACGYDVFTIADGLGRGVFPLASLFVGSEGTLGIVTQVTLRVLPLPQRRATLLIYLDRFDDLAAVVADLLPKGPSAMEAIDGDTLDLLDRAGLGVPSRARAMLLVEFDDGDVAARAEAAAGDVARGYALSRPIEVATDAERQASLWRARRAVLPTILRRPDRRKAWGFVEDPIVPRERVPEFMQFLSGLARKYGTVAAIYGHIGDGNTHYRPLFDPTDPEEFARMQALRAEFDEAVLNRFRGAPSGEHGIGRLRAETLRNVWGPEIYGIMRDIKELLDPGNLLNPGVLLGEAPWWETWAGLESRTPM